jgi:hypothetical protein
MRYIVSFGPDQVGLTPSIAIFKRLDTLADVPGAPTVTEIPGSGAYQFEWNPQQGDPDIFFQVDGGPSIDGAGRYQEGVVSPEDVYLEAVKTKTDQIPNDLTSRLNAMQANIIRLLGLTKENSVLDQTTFDSRNNLTGGRLRIFGSKSDAQAGVSPLAVYTIAATYAEGTANILTYSMVRDA